MFSNAPQVANPPPVLPPFFVPLFPTTHVRYYCSIIHISEQFTPSLLQDGENVCLGCQQTFPSLRKLWNHLSRRKGCKVRSIELTFSFRSQKIIHLCVQIFHCNSIQVKHDSVRAGHNPVSAPAPVHLTGEIVRKVQLMIMIVPCTGKNFIPSLFVF